MTLIIRSVELRDFLSHHSTRLSLERGVTVLVGENGAGKSSIVDAVYLALTGDYTVRGPRRDLLIRRGAPRAEVVVRLEDTATGGEAVVSVAIPRGGTGSMTLKVNGRLEASGVREVPKAVANLLGIPASELREARGAAKYALVLRQGYLREIIDYLTTSPEERSRFFDSVLGSSAYRKAGEALRDLDVEVEGYRLTASQSSLRMLSSAEEKLRSEARRLEAARAALLREVREFEEKLAGLEERLRRAEEARGEYERLKAALEAVEERLRSVEEELAALEAEEARLKPAAARLAELEAERERVARLASLAGLAAELERARARLEEAEARARQAARLAEAVRELAEHAWAEERLGAVKSRLEEARRRLADARARQARLEERLRAAEEAAGRAEREAAALARLAGIPAGGPGEVLERALAEAGRLRREAEGLEEEAGRLASRAAKARGSAERLLLYAESLKGERGDRCPLCGQPLPRGGAGELRARLVESARSLEEEAGRLEAEARRLEARAREALERARLIEAAAERLKASLEAAGGEGVEELRRRAEEARAEAESAQLEAEELEAEAVRLEDAAKKALAARARARELAASLGLQGIPGPREAGEAARRALEEAEAARRRVEELEAELASKAGLPSAGEALRAVYEAVKASARVEAEYRRALEAAARLRNVEERLEALRAERERLLAERRGVEERLRSLEPLALEADRLRAERDEASRRLGEARGRLSQVGERLGEIREELGRVERARWQLAKLLKLRELMEKTIPRTLLQARLASLEAAMNEVLESFGLEYRSVVISTSEDSRGTPLIEVSAVSSQGETASLSSLSGGEKTAVALAFALALGRISSLNAGFLVLDEPTAELDEERRKVLVEVIKRMGGGIPQLIVVTHDEDVKEAADTICTVSKPGGVSVVKCGGGE
ncbi:AAA family ATPase [Stetteria hydrogenophila]